MADQLTAVRTTKITTRTNESVVPSTPNQLQHTRKIRITSPEDVLQTLQEQPSVDALEHVLEYLVQPGVGSFDIRVPGPLSAKIINTLVNTTIPDYWLVLNSSSTGSVVVSLLKECLCNVSGIGAVVARLKLLVAEISQTSRPTESKNVLQHIQDLLDVLTQMLNGERVAENLWKNISNSITASSRRTILWREFLSLTASGRVLSTAAQAEDILKAGRHLASETWLAKGPDYAKWLGRNVVCMACTASTKEGEKLTATAHLCGKALTLGYTDQLVGEVVMSVLTAQKGDIHHLQQLVISLHPHEQRKFLESALSYLTNRYLASGTTKETESHSKERSSKISGTAALLRHLISNNEGLKEDLVGWLAGNSGPAIGTSIAMKRASLAALAGDEESIQRIMEKAMEQFGDQLYIKHTPILQQEGMAQTLLLTCGYVHRSLPMYLFTMAKSSIFTNGISNRLAASSPRARFLGMVVGMAISELVDKTESVLKFDIDVTLSGEVKWYRQLIYIDDEVGSVADLKATETVKMGSERKAPPNTASGTRTKENLVARPTGGKAKPAVMPSGLRIVEVDDSSEDEDLVPYMKPDSDPEDDHDDPTLVKRNKPVAPVYIRDLLTGLRSTDDHDRYLLALSNAASLIRGKASFGREVSDHIEELAAVVVGLSNPFEFENFQEMRQQAMVAVLLAQPAQMAQWFARNFFEGDFSLDQRVAILTTLGLGARELAGFKDDTGITGSSSLLKDTFPSKVLPEKLHKMYASTTTPVDSLAKRLERTMIEPMALNAADQLSGPNALKVRTFSSRMEVEKKRKKPIPNELAKIVAQNFFFPLTGRWWTQTQARGSQDLYTMPILLHTYLKTLALILHASGASTLSLPQMTSEFWDLLLSVRTNALSDVSVLEAVLFAFLTLLEVNEDKQRLAQEHAKELLETQEWAKMVLDRTGGGDDEGNTVRMLAAGVVMRSQEVAEKYQRLLLGDVMDF